MKVPYPIILLHGLGQKADVWHGAATKYFLEELGLRHGGDLRVDASKNVRASKAGGGDADLYTVTFSSAFDSVNAWRDEVEAVVTYVRNVTGADRVTLVGYSMGGLAARAYLVKRLTDHHVKRLITIGTPHLGSPYARIWNWKSRMEECASNGNVIAVPPCKAALAAIQGAEGDVPFDAPAVRDLRRPEDGGDYLRRLSKYSHPLDVEYVSVVGDVNLLDEVTALRQGAIQETLRKVLAAATGTLGELFEPGDGVVSTKSQNIMNIEFFNADKSRQRMARTVNVSSAHVDHLARNSDVQRILLDEKPEYKGASICLVGGFPTLVVDVQDHIPMLCSVAATINSSPIASYSAANGSARLVRTQSGIFARFTLPLSNVPLDVPDLYTINITITNSFGYVVRATVEW